MLPRKKLMRDLMRLRIELTRRRGRYGADLLRGTGVTRDEEDRRAMKLEFSQNPEIVCTNVAFTSCSQPTSRYSHSEYLLANGVHLWSNEDWRM